MPLNRSAEVCENTTTYADMLDVEDAIGIEDYLDEEFYNRIRILLHNYENYFYKYTIGTGTYCPVYCVETDTFTWPGFSPITNQGEHYTWTIGKDNEQNIIDGRPANLEGRTDCTNNRDLETMAKRL
jgi:hypothetical protein